MKWFNVWDFASSNLEGGRVGHRVNKIGHELIVETGRFQYIFAYVGNFPWKKVKEK